MRIFTQERKQSQQQIAPDCVMSNAPLPAVSEPTLPLLQMQRTIGNQAVQRMLKTKPHANVQAKLTVNTPGDIYEQEADHLAARVMRIPEPQLQRECHCGGKCDDCLKGQEMEGHERLQTKRIQSTGAGEVAAPPIVQEVLSSPGQQLDRATRTFMEPRFGLDFGRVRVHTDAKAAESARAVNALAYTVGRSIVFNAGQYAPETAAGRDLLAHELAHVAQQTPSGGLFLQRRLVTESAGGCGLCKEARFVGSEVHTEIQYLSFPLYIHPEYPIFNGEDEENGRLDLLELEIDNDGRTIQANIGEIKPNNLSGIKRGVKDLAFYKGIVYRYFKERFPDYSVFVGFLDIEPDPAILPYTETPECPSQMIEIENAKDGLYLYNCSPTRRELKDFKGCCEKKEDENRAEAGQHLTVITLHQQLSQRAEESIRKTQEQQEAQEESPSDGARKIAGIAASATRIGRIAKYHYEVYKAFAEWAYTGMYWGTRGYNLNETFQRLANATEPLALQTGAVTALDQDISTVSSIDSNEQATAGMRAELLSSLRHLRWLMRALNSQLDKARDSSAIESYFEFSLRSDTGFEAVRLWLDNADAVIYGDDDSQLSLSLATNWLTDAASWLIRRVEYLFDNYVGIVKADQKAWLELRH